MFADKSETKRQDWTIDIKHIFSYFCSKESEGGIVVALDEPAWDRQRK